MIAVDHGAVTVLQKPYTMNQFFTALCRAEPEGIVLLVDDDPDISGDLSQFLGAKGYRVLAAATGEQALQCATKSTIDALILDLQLPVINGLETYLELRRHGHVLPTIIISGGSSSTDVEDIEILRSLELTGCLFKPFELSDLLELIHGVDRDTVLELVPEPGT